MDFLYLSILMFGGYGENKRIKARLSEEIVLLQRWEVKQENLLLIKQVEPRRVKLPALQDDCSALQAFQATAL